MEWEYFESRFRSLVANITEQFKVEVDVEGQLALYKELAEKFKGMIVDGIFFVNDAINQVFFFFFLPLFFPLPNIIPPSLPFPHPFLPPPPPPPPSPPKKKKKKKKKKRVLFEGANAVLLDIDYGTYPYVTSSSPGSNGIVSGLGLRPALLADTEIIGIVKGL